MRVSLFRERSSPLRVLFLILLLENGNQRWCNNGKSRVSAEVAIEERIDDEEIVSKSGKECPVYGCVSLPEDLIDTSVFQRVSALTTNDDNDGVHTATLTLVGYKGGRLEDQINQDRAFAISPYVVANDDRPSQLLGVFDGHGRLGERVSEHAVSTLPALLHEHLSGRSSSDEDEREAVTKILVDAFVSLDATVPTAGVGGCTASIMLRVGDDLYASNAGDSRSFLVGHDVRRNATRLLYATREDKPDLPDERARVERMGGYVFTKKGRTSRVYYVDSDNGGQVGLAMSRSLGDWDAGKVGVVATPLVDVLSLTDARANQNCGDAAAVGEATVDDDGNAIVAAAASDEPCDPLELFAVSATDGMLDHATPEHMADVLAQSLYGSVDDETKQRQHLMKACQDLIVHAASGWTEENRGQYRDDIAISVSRIKV